MAERVLQLLGSLSAHAKDVLMYLWRQIGRSARERQMEMFFGIEDDQAFAEFQEVGTPSVLATTRSWRPAR